MRFSWNWLGEYVELPPKVEEVARGLTLAGLAVELIEPLEGDVVLDIDVTTNRPDAMNHLGLAREVAVILGKELRRPEIELQEAEEENAAAARVEVEDGEGCPRYVARVIRGVQVGPSPEWLRRRLEAIGLRPINNVVDITNYVLHESGQPLHAFDLGKLQGRKIVVRRARAGEALVTLDGVRRELTPEILVIADEAVPVALAGIMGGLETEVTGTTVDVLLESAHFHRTVVRRGARQVDLHTDASHRFERGADPGACLEAADRAAALIAQVAGGRVLKGALDVRNPEITWHLEGRLELARLHRFAGVEIPASEVEGWLQSLGFEMKTLEAGVWRVTVPSWRYYDFLRPQASGEIYEADLYEEVLRLYGYDRLPSTLPALAGPDAGDSGVYLRRERIRRHLAASGYLEAINLAFCDRPSDESFPVLPPAGQAVALANPLSDRHALLRRSLLPGLVESARFNRRRGVPAVRLFELGSIFFQGEGGEVEEVEVVGLVAGGRLGTPWERQVELDLFDLKGAVEGLAAEMGVRLVFRPATFPAFLPGASAEILLDSPAEAVVGHLGRILDEDGEGFLFAAEVALRAFGEGRRDLKVQIPSRFPGISADLTLTHPVEVPWAAIRQAIESRRPPDLVDFGLKDRYQGEGVSPGAVNTTIYFLYNSWERSLTQEEVNERQVDLAARLQRQFGQRE